MTWLVRSAPAKVNLWLRVLGRLPNGYHAIDSLMLPIELCDTLSLRLAPATAIEVHLTCPGHPQLQGPDNLAHRAAVAYLQARGMTGRLEMVLEKKIPVAAGLGGGSSDASATLLILQQLVPPGLEPDRLDRLAVQLGADVPFFLRQGPCLARGIGEILTPVPGLPPIWLVLACAPFGLSTREVYAKLDYRLTSQCNDGTGLRPVFAGNAVDIAAFLRNDLQPTGENLRPVIGEVNRELLQAGALGAQMSGSGPTVFGLFGTREAAEAAVVRLAKREDWQYLVAKGITTSGNRA